MRRYPRHLDAVASALLLFLISCSASSSDDRPRASGGAVGAGGRNPSAGGSAEAASGSASTDGGAAGSSDDSSDSAGSSGSDDTGGALGAAGGNSTLHLDAPANAETLVPFLESGAYSNWHAEPGFHPSAGPHGARVRTFYGPLAVASLQAREATFPAGAATIKELAGEDGAVTGWSVWVKVQASSDGGRGFYWYEANDGQVYADALGFGSCVGCHSAGADFLRSSGIFE